MSPPLNREILLAFWKVHILHHASERAVYGLWLIEELAEHGYRLSPGTLYPILERMERNGWLRSRQRGHVRSRRTYRITAEGRRVLDEVRGWITELNGEVVLGRSTRRVRSASPRSSGRTSPRGTFYSSGGM